MGTGSVFSCRRGMKYCSKGSPSQKRKIIEWFQAGLGLLGEKVPTIGHRRAQRIRLKTATIERSNTLNQYIIIYRNKNKPRYIREVISIIP